MTFYTSLSGLQVAQTDMSTISHNLANVATNGFKKSRSDFADVIASNFTTDPRRMVGSGAVLKQNVQEFGEGSLATTGNSLDLAISGDGFFAVKTPSALGALAYTRNGSFSVSNDRYIVDAQGSRLQAYPVESDGTTAGTTLSDVRIPETSGEATATKAVTLKVNLNTAAAAPTTTTFSPSDPTSYNNATNTTVIDANGNPTTMTTYFVRDAATGTDNGSSSWTMYNVVAGETLNDKSPTKVTFDGNGNLTSPIGQTSLAFATDATSGSTPRTITLDLSGSTGAKQAFSVASRSQDGKGVGLFSGISVDSDGVISASYSNNDTVKLGKVALANFVNPTGLRQTGNSYWASSGISGAATMGSANQNGFGNLMSGTIEGSNVDITEELVNLIAAQRNFQANAKALDTQSQISETIFNIRS